MKLVKENLKGNSCSISVIIGNKGKSSWWQSPPKDEKHFDLEYIRDNRYPIVNTKKKLQQFQELYNNLWINVTDGQLSDMKHALGLDYGKKPYRNRYYDFNDNSNWNNLIEKGLAKKNKPSENNQVCFWLTKQGVEYVLEKSVSDKVYEEL